MKSSAIRWLPALLAPVLIAGAIATPAIAAAVPPTLPERSVTQVLALGVTGERVRGYTATIEQKAALGLPDLSGLAGGSSNGYRPNSSSSPSSAASGDSSDAAAQALSVLTADQRARVQVSGQGLKIQLTTGSGEKSLTMNSKEAWTWDWDSREATRYTFPKASKLTENQQRALTQLRAESTSRLSQLNPQALAKSLLAKADESTEITLGSNVRVAGQAAYEVVLTPKQNASLVRNVRVAIDSKTGMVLRVQVWAKAQSKLAYSLSYTSLNYAVPAASNFTFTPPSEAKVIQKSSPVTSKAQRTEIQQQLRQLEAKVKAADTPVKREQLKKDLVAQAHELLADAQPSAASNPVVSSIIPDLDAVSISGSGWASVVHLPAGTLDAASLKQLKSLLTPLGGGAYGLTSTLLSARIGADGSVTLGSVSLLNLN